jgi:flavin-dependent dehydrogenase
VICPTTSSAEIETWDVIVIGAGPAGTSAAISSSRCGHSVLLLDAKKFPRHKICGGCLNQVSINLLNSLIGDDHPFWQTGNQLDSFSLHHRGRTFSIPMPLGLAVERSQLDQCLVDVAIQSGVTFRDSATGKLGDMEDDEGDYRMVEIKQSGRTSVTRAKSVVVAGGLNNRCVADSELLQQSSTDDSRVGVETVLAKNSMGERSFLDSQRAIRMAVGRIGYGGITELSDGRLHIAASVDRSALRQLGPLGTVNQIFSEAGVKEVPDAAGVWRGSPPLTSRASRLGDRRVFLVGDAATYVEPFTGEGIRWALQSGIGVTPFVQRAVEGWRDNLTEQWESWYWDNIGRSQKLCARISWALKSPTTCFVAHQVLRFQPWLAGQVAKRLNQAI